MTAIQFALTLPLRVLSALIERLDDALDVTFGGDE